MPQKRGSRRRRWWWLLPLLVLAACDGGTRGSGIGAGFSTLSGSLASSTTGASLTQLAIDSDPTVIVQVREFPDIQTTVDPVSRTFTLADVPSGDVTIDFISTDTASIALRGLPENVDLQMVDVAFVDGIAKPAGFAVTPQEGNRARVVASRRKGAAPLEATFAVTDVTAPSANLVDWSFGDGGFTGNPNPVHTYEAPGNYVVQSVVGTAPNQQRAFTVVEVFEPGEQSLQVTATADPAFGLPPLNVTFRATAENAVGTVTYAWDFFDGSPIDSGATIRHPFTLEGIYLVQVVASDSLGNEGRDVVQIEVRDGTRPVPLSVRAEVDQAVGPAPLTVRLRAVITGSGPVTIEWTFDDGTNSSTEPSPLHTYVAPRLYRPRVVVKELNSTNQVSDDVVVEVTDSSTTP